MGFHSKFSSLFHPLLTIITSEYWRFVFTLGWYARWFFNKSGTSGLSTLTFTGSSEQTFYIFIFTHSAFRFRLFYVKKGLKSKRGQQLSQYLLKYLMYIQLFPSRQASELGGHLRGKLIYWGGGGKIDFCPYRCHRTSPPPQEIRPLSKGGDIPRNTAPGGRIS